LVDDIVVESRFLEPGKQHFLNLALFLDRAAGQDTIQVDTEPASIWSNWRRSQKAKARKEPVTEFTICYKNADADNEVVATYDFKVLDSATFRLAKLAHNVLHDQTAHEVDANPNAPTWPCWNCDSVGRNRRTTCDNCGAPRNHPNSLKWQD